MPEHVFGHWTPRKPGLLEPIQWEIFASPLEKKNFERMYSFATYIIRTVGIDRTATVEIRPTGTVKDSSRFRAIARFLRELSSETENGIYKPTVIGFMSASLTHVYLSGQSGMNDSFKFFEKEHAAIALDFIPHLKKYQGRDLFNASLNVYLNSLPPRIRELSFM